MSEDPPPPEPRRPAFRRAMRRMLLGLVGLALVLAIGLHLPPIERSLVNLALARLKAPIGADVQFQSVRYNLFSRTVTIDGLRVGAPGVEPLVSAAHVHVSFPTSAFRGALDGLDITLENADVVLLREGGRWISVPQKWLGDGTPGGTPRPLPAFAALRLHNVSVRYEDRDAKFVAETKGLNVDLLPAGSGRPGDLAGPLVPGATSQLSWYPRGTALTLVGGRGRYSPEGTGVDDLRVQAAEGVITTNVAFTFRGTDRLHLRALGDLRGEALRAWLPMLDTLKGPLLVDFRIPATHPPAFADVGITGKNVSWRNVVLTEVIASGALETGGITLADTRVRAAGGTLEGHGRLAWEHAGQSKAVVSFQDLDGGQLWRTLLASSRGALIVTPGSLVSGRFEGRWTDWHAATLDGHVETRWRARKRGLAGAERLWLDGRVDARFLRGPWTINVDARADGALGVAGTVYTRGSERDYGDWPFGGNVSLSGATAETMLDAFRLADLDARPELKDATGTLSGDAALSGTFATARASVTLHAGLAWPDQPPVTIDAHATVDPAAVSVDVLEATSGPSEASATTLIDFRRDTIDGRFDATRVPIEAWTRRFGLGTPAEGPINLTGRLVGPIGRALVDASFDGGPVVVEGQTLAKVSGRVRYGDGVLNADNLRFAARAGGELTGQGAWTRKTGAVAAALTLGGLALDADVPDVTTVDGRPSGRLSAHIDGEIQVGGTASAPTVEATLQAPSLMLDDASFGPLAATVRTSNGVARVDARARDLGAVLAARVALAGDRAFTAELGVHSADSPLAARVHGLDVALGAIDLVGHAAGSLTNAALTSARLTLDRFDAIADALPLAVAQGAQVTWQPGRLEVASLDVASGSTHLKIAGRLDGQPDHTLEARLDGRLEDLHPAVAALAPAGHDAFVFEGPFTASISARGTPDTPVLTGTLTLEGARAGDGVKPPVTGINVRAALDRDQLRLDLVEGHWQGAHAAVAGTLPSWFLRVPGARHGGDASLTGHVDDVTIKVLEPFESTEALGATDFNLRIEYTVHAREPTLQGLVADVHVTDAALTSRELGLTQEGQGHLTVRDGVAILEPWTIGASTLKTHLTVGGRVGLTGTPRVDARLDGQVDLRSLALVLGTYRPAGQATLSATLHGPLPTPDVQGFVTLQHGELLIRDPRLVFAEVKGTVRFAGDQLTVEGVTGSVNGGALEAHGTMRQPGRGKPSGQVAITVNGALFDFPRGFRSMVDAELTLAGHAQDARLTLGGTATIVDAGYRESFIVTGGLLSLFQQKSALVIPTVQRQTGREPFVLDVRVLANDSINIDTSYGRVAVGTNLRVFGPPSNIRILGQADIAPGGQIFFGGHTYQVESGRFEFRDPTTLTPDVHLVAQSTIAGYNITMRIETTEGRTETRLTSDPPLPEEQIASLMVSGQVNSTAAPGDVVTQQLTAVLSGEITSAVGRAIGLDSVRLESGNRGDVLMDPSLVSAESNPAQRLTFSKRILPNLEVIVSQNLRESGQFTYIIGWQVVPRFELRFVQLDTQDRSYEIRHDVSFGGGVRAQTVKQRVPETVAHVYVAAIGDVTEAEVRAILRITEGRHFDFFKWQGDRDKLQKLFLDRGYYEARITARREPSTPPPSDGKTSTPVDLGYTIDEGPATALVVTGVTPPPELRRALIDAWVDTPVDELLNEEFSTLLVPWLAAQGDLRPKVATRVDTVGARKTALVSVTPGTQSTRRHLVFTGNEHVSSPDLQKAVTRAGLADRMWTAPADLQKALVSTYHQLGYLAVQVKTGLPHFEGDLAELPVQIVEGPVFHAGVVRVEDPGATPPPGVDLTPPVLPGTVLTDTVARDGTRALQQRYRRAGYRGTRVAAQSTARADGSTDLVFKVTRGQRMTFGTLTIAGAEGPERALIAELVPFTPGEPVSLDVLNRARDRLYDTDLFRTVNIDATPRQAKGEEPAPPLTDATITVELLPKYRLRYGFQLFDPYTPAVSPKWGAVDPGVVADLTRRGLFGRGLTAGVSGRANQADRVVRTYLSSREFFGMAAQTNFYVGDEWKRQLESGFVLQQRTRDITIEQRIRRRGLQLAYGYDFQVLSQDLLVSEPVPVPVQVPTTIKANIGRLIASLYYDRRDSAVDTMRGWFHSTSVEFGPEWLGSTAAIRKFLNQDFYFLPLPGTLVLGSAARFEAVSGPGQNFIISERLRAGGGTTVRGYEDVSLQLLSAQQNFTGRSSLLVWNEEIRFPLYRRLRGATFWDHATLFGNFPLPDVNKSRNGVGGGVRLVLPFILLRVDYGYPLDQGPINNKGRWYFAIGQAF